MKLHLVVNSWMGWLMGKKMPKTAAELGALEVNRLSHRGGKHNDMIAVGGVAGLYLQITPANGKTWVLRMRIGDRRRDMGLGGFPTVTLAMAREKARLTRERVARGIDPVVERKVARAQLVAQNSRRLTFKDAVETALSAKLGAFKNEKHRKQWQSTLDTYALPQLGAMEVQDITVQDVLRVLEPIWSTKTETASRLRGRIETVLSWATVAGYRKGENPARWAGNLKELLPAASTIKNADNQPALALTDIAAWFSDLHARQGCGARALEFAALTAARSGEVRGALWEEIDLTTRLWTISAARMKMKREHRVPLSSAALALLDALPRLAGNPLVFPAARGGQLSDMTLSATMKRIHDTSQKRKGGLNGLGYVDPRSKRPAVPHGLRSSFRDWAADKTQYPGELAEVALAHRINNAVEAAYRRGDMLEKRRQMMDDWASFMGA